MKKPLKPKVKLMQVRYFRFIVPAHETDRTSDPAANAEVLNYADVSRSTKTLFRREEEPQYYEALDSLAGDEEVVLVDRPDTAAVLDEAAADIKSTRAAQQTTADSGYATRSNSSKRTHEALSSNVEAVEANAKQTEGGANGKQSLLACLQAIANPTLL